jgi:hypothetical protein
MLEVRGTTAKLNRVRRHCRLPSAQLVRDSRPRSLVSGVLTYDKSEYARSVTIDTTCPPNWIRGITHKGSDGR